MTISNEGGKMKKGQPKRDASRATQVAPDRRPSRRSNAATAKARIPRDDYYVMMWTHIAGLTL